MGGPTVPFHHRRVHREGCIESVSTLEMPLTILQDVRVLWWPAMVIVLAMAVLCLFVW
jgi:hypothetical protein